MTPATSLPLLRQRSFDAIVVGGSAGGIDALGILLAALPEPLLVPVLVVLHVGADSKALWSSIFKQSTAPVLEAEDKLLAEPGRVYMAPPDYHLLVDASGQLSLSVDERVNLSRPSIDVLFESAAWAYGARLLGIVLSGANADGAAGLGAIRQRGGSCWVQAPETALARAMPRAALGAAPDATILSPAAMAEVFRASVP
jgi:two-component system chemotaxis response regulator CheB